MFVSRIFSPACCNTKITLFGEKRSCTFYMSVSTHLLTSKTYAANIHLFSMDRYKLGQLFYQRFQRNFLITRVRVVVIIDMKQYCLFIIFTPRETCSKTARQIGAWHADGC